MFIRNTPEFYKTDWIGDSSTGLTDGGVSNPAAFVTLVRNPDSGAGFWILRQNDSTSTYGMHPLTFNDLTLTFVTVL